MAEQANNLRSQDRMICRRQEPGIVRRWGRCLFQVMQAVPDSGSHFGRRFREYEAFRSCGRRWDGKVGDVRAQDDEDIVRASLPQGRDDMLDDRPAAQRQGELGAAHASAVTRRGDHGKEAPDRFDHWSSP